MSRNKKSISDPKVLSVQSHVVYGYCGNRSAVFPMQVLGLEVDFINSVQFSNHTWYNHCKGQVLDADQLNEIYQGLVLNSLTNYDFILTGYIGSLSFLEKIVEIIKEIKSKNPNLIYLCDPVMGDDGNMYVPKELLPVYKSQVLSLADIIVPNQFEAELLTGVVIKTEADALSAIDILHSCGVTTVVLSSTDLGGEDVLLSYASHRDSCGKTSRVRVHIPRWPHHFVGTGDLFAALILAYTQKHPDDLKLVFKKVIGTMQAVLKRTVEHGKALVPPGTRLTPAHLELRLIQSLPDIMNPNLHDAIDDI